jgi:hypothetical protein
MDGDWASGLIFGARSLMEGAGRRANEVGTGANGQQQFGSFGTKSRQRP